MTQSKHIYGLGMTFIAKRITMFQNLLIRMIKVLLIMDLCITMSDISITTKITICI